MRLCTTASALAAAYLLLPLAAHADTLNIAFQLNGPAYGYSGSGTFTVNTTPGQITYNSTNGLGTITGTLDGDAFTGLDSSVTWDNGQLVGMTGYAFGSDAGGANGFHLGDLNFVGTQFEADYEAPNPPGSLSPANHYGSEEGSITAAIVSSGTTAVTPEPSTFALLGTGLLGLTRIVRRRRGM